MRGSMDVSLLVSMLLIIVAARNPRVDPIAAPISRFNGLPQPGFKQNDGGRGDDTVNGGKEFLGAQRAESNRP